jgi:hypothetical protein
LLNEHERDKMEEQMEEQKRLTELSIKQQKEMKSQYEESENKFRVEIERREKNGIKEFFKFQMKILNLGKDFY